MATKLPEDVVSHILSCLPVKSLMRFRSVCKLWYNLLQTQYFISKHHNTQIARSNFAVIVKHGKLPNECFSVLSSNGRGETLGVVETISISLPKGFPKFDPPFVLAGNVNGLFYLYDGFDVPALWNPATREFKQIPVSPIELLPGSLTRFTYDVGFGFDSKNNDYKIIKFAYNFFGENETEKDQIELYSLKSDSWKEIPCVDDVVSFRNPWDHSYNDGFYYWWTSSRGPLGSQFTRCPFILRFNFADEVFEKLPPPDCGVLDEKIPLITALNGTISIVIFNPPKVSKKSIDIWVIKEDGAKKSWEWEKQMSIDLVEGCHAALGFWKSRIFFMDEQEKLNLYNPSTRKLRKVELVGEIDTWQVLSYVESLVPLTSRLGRRF